MQVEASHRKDHTCLENSSSFKGNKEATWEATPEKLAVVAVLTVRHLLALLLLSTKSCLKISFCLLLAGNVAKSVECLPRMHGKPWAPFPTLHKTGHGIEHL